MKGHSGRAKAALIPLILLTLCASAYALQDAYVFFDSKDTAICLAIDDPSTFSCNVTQAVAVDGTSDHMAYFIPQSELASNATQAQTISYFLLEPINYIIAIAVIMFALLVGVGLTYGLIRAAGVRVG